MFQATFFLFHFIFITLRIINMKIQFCFIWFSFRLYFIICTIVGFSTDFRHKIGEYTFYANCVHLFLKHVMLTVFNNNFEIIFAFGQCYCWGCSLNSNMAKSRNGDKKPFCIYDCRIFPLSTNDISIPNIGWVQLLILRDMRMTNWT